MAGDAAVCTACVAELMGLPVPPTTRLDGGRVVAGFSFADSVREVLHRGKFGGDRGALVQLAELTALRLDLRWHAAHFAAMVAVPLGPRRRRQRGYNQAEV
ncbi:MAG: hypothetical protein JOY80_02255, partial [Candidatus Dormibacteraeota bacterium]|nr:hypothetical protein [Candidatus Dormibacteraeota bacterium]